MKDFDIGKEQLLQESLRASVLNPGNFARRETFQKDFPVPRMGDVWTITGSHRRNTGLLVTDTLAPQVHTGILWHTKGGRVEAPRNPGNTYNPLLVLDPHMPEIILRPNERAANYIRSFIMTGLTVYRPTDEEFSRLNTMAARNLRNAGISLASIPVIPLAIGAGVNVMLRNADPAVYCLPFYSAVAYPLFGYAAARQLAEKAYIQRKKIGELLSGINPLFAEYFNPRKDG